MLSNLEPHFSSDNLRRDVPDDDSLSSSSSDSEYDHHNVSALSGEQPPLEFPWTLEEDEILRSSVEGMAEPKNWVAVAEALPGRTNKDCKRRWNQLMRSQDGRSRTPWTKEEDELLKELVAQHGSKQWKLISSMMNGRKSKQCRERWTNVVDPKLNYAPWTEEEEQILIQAQQELGNKWSQIEKRLPGRSANSIKNYWYSALRRGERKRAKIERKAMQQLEGKKRRPRKSRAGDGSELDVYAGLGGVESISSNSSFAENVAEAALSAESDYVAEEKPKKRAGRKPAKAKEAALVVVGDAAVGAVSGAEGDAEGAAASEPAAKKRGRKRKVVAANAEDAENAGHAAEGNAEEGEAGAAAETENGGEGAVVAKAAVVRKRRKQIAIVNDTLVPAPVPVGTAMEEES